MFIKRAKQRGETIVEVLICVVILSSALGGAYAVANRSRNTVQDNYERFQAQMLANQQAEYLRAYYTQSSTTRPTPSASPSDRFCLYLDSTPELTKVPITDLNCKQYDLYSINIETLSGDPLVPPYKYNTFKIQITWDSVLSKAGQSKVEVIYGT